MTEVKNNIFWNVTVKSPHYIVISVLLIIFIHSNIAYAGGLDKKLIKALTSGDLNKIDKLIKSGADLNAKNVDGGTLFHLLANKTAMIEVAIRDKQIKKKKENEIIKLASYIFKKGAKPNVANNRGRTPLFSTSVNMAKWLLDKGLSPNSRASIDRRRGGVTPLMTHASQGKFELVKLLLENGANPHLKDHKGFHAACYAQDRILDYGYPPYSRRSKTTALGYASIIKVLSEYGAGKEMPVIIAPPSNAKWSVKMNHKHSLRCKVNGKYLR